VVQVAPPVAVAGEIELDGQPGHRCEVRQSWRRWTDRARGAYRFQRERHPIRTCLSQAVPADRAAGMDVGPPLPGVGAAGRGDITLDELEVVPGMMPFRWY